MPGKVNPTQAEALCMVAAHVMGNDVAIGIAGAGGQLELNVYKPMLLHDLLESIELLADACDSFRERCVVGIEPNHEAIARHLGHSLMLVTALVPLLGYDAAAKLAKAALDQGVSLRDAALASGLVTGAEYDAHVKPEEMVRPA
jgi:fumarate hydratase class II